MVASSPNCSTGKEITILCETVDMYLPLYTYHVVSYILSSILLLVLPIGQLKNITNNLQSALCITLQQQHIIIKASFIFRGESNE